MSKVPIEPHRPIYPSPAALITTTDAEGTPNIITLAEVFNISIQNPVIVGISVRKATYSHQLISATREFVVNLPTAAMVKQVDQCGLVSGRDGYDKFHEFGLTALPSTHVRPPLIKECPINVECKVLEIVPIGDHDLITGEVVAVHADSDKIAEDGTVNVASLDGLVYLREEYWSFGKKVGRRGIGRLGNGRRSNGDAGGS